MKIIQNLFKGKAPTNEAEIPAGKFEKRLETMTAPASSRRPVATAQEAPVLFRRNMAAGA